MILKSKIKEVLSDELLKLIASICDTRRIDSLQRKMTITQQLLKSHNVRFEVLGGATNRLSLYISGMVFKIAMDRQGYKDNLMEYALSKELQPYVTKTFETNGYISIAETVRVMTREEWKLRRVDILRILDILGRSYLLGDVGYINKNFTNWGIRDDGNVVILDYAYVHRGTAKLFLCDVCGDGILAYDATFSELRCTNVTGSCGVRYSYIERKMIEGDQVDYDMIDDVRDNQSIKLPKGVSFKKVKVDDTNDVLVDGNTVIIRSPEEHRRWEMEVNKMERYYDKPSMLNLMIKIVKAKDPEEKQRLQKEYDALYKESTPEELKDVSVKIAYDENETETPAPVPVELMDDEETPEKPQNNSGEFNVNEGCSMSELLHKIHKVSGSVTAEVEPDDAGISIGEDFELSFGGFIMVSKDDLYDVNGIELSSEVEVIPNLVLGDDDAEDEEGIIVADNGPTTMYNPETVARVEEENAFKEAWDASHPVEETEEPAKAEEVEEVSEPEKSDDTEIVEDDSSDVESEYGKPILSETMSDDEAEALARELEQRLLKRNNDAEDEHEITIDGKPLHEVM